ncbi:site-specific DNA-methyltransferase [uncultured Deefgea sp.]|uniref:site-specific DNA-methyltransferase n=1 Tax=uncultured Deefgea sp. TaxID=1304914 RepID=UPI0025995AB3|nr:site-specific DNA-methyltransferase [uncultured Deefgea sp.]
MSIQKIDAQSPEAQSANLISDNINQLRALFPELVTETANGVSLNVDILKQLIGDATASDAEEKYGLNWHGKRRARQIALTPSTGTLRPCVDESVNWDTTQNLMIEGDNLEVLKLLQKSYAGEVKLIYIDPPYNTGKDFVYPDNFQDNIKNYLELTGQIEGGAKISSNTDASGRFHTDWLNMMYPRLKLARTLLKEGGIILVSIDDHEIHNARLLMDDLYGEESLLGCFTYRRRQRADNRNQSNVSSDHEYILAYAKGNGAKFNGKLVDTEKYTNPDNDHRGAWSSIDLSGLATKDQRPNLHYNILDPITGISYPPNPNRGWSKSKSVVELMIAEGRVLFPKLPTGRPREKKFLADLKSDVTGFSTWLDSNQVGFSTDGTREITELLGGRAFDFPKPLSLISTLINQATSTEDLVLDFFAGSGTTGHAVMAANALDGGVRRFICCQLPEPLDSNEFSYRSLSDVTKDRLRRAGKQIKTNNPLFSGDTGFRVFKLDTSNIRAWQPTGDLKEDLFANEQHLHDDRSNDDVLYELLLKLGVDLCVRIDTQTIAGKECKAIGGGVLLACLSEHIAANEAEALAMGLVAWRKALDPAGDSTAVFRDSAFENDVAKSNLAAILEQHGVKHVRSL